MKTKIGNAQYEIMTLSSSKELIETQTRKKFDELRDDLRMLRSDMRRLREEFIIYSEDKWIKKNLN